MLKNQILNQISSQIKNILDSSPVQDVEKNIKAAFSAILDKVEIVTREEFNTHQQVLLHTRERVEELAQEIVKMQERIPH